MTIGKVVIVGSGQGGFQAAASLRQEGFEGEITVIGEEPGLPYQRPPLSKAYMADGKEDRLFLKPGVFYERNRIKLLESQRVATICRADQAVVTADGVVHAYDHLILATGARNIRPAFPGVDLAGVLDLRTLGDAAVIRSRLTDMRHAVVIGGGFIGLEFAAMARAAGVAVTVVEAAGRLMLRAVTPDTSQRFLRAHREMGSVVRLDAPAKAIVGARSTAGGVALADGEEIPADLVLIAVGVRPNAELAAEAGLDVANGVVVDSSLLTSDPAISALGDCACFPGPEGHRIRLESVQAAVDHARHIARRLVKDDRRAYVSVPWFWSDQGALKLQIAGLSSGADDHLAVTEANGEPTVLCFKAGRLKAVETVNNPGIHIAARGLIGTPRADLETTGFDLRAFAKARTGATQALEAAVA